MHFSRSPLIIAGMGRSGTSLTTSLLQSAGLHVGENFLPVYPGAVRGLFENLDFVHFHKKQLRELGQPEEGWVTSPLPKIGETARLEARQLIAQNQKDTAWGWKDPRTTVFLNFWSELIPDAKFLFLIRSPWNVIDSLYRRGDAAFLTHPSLALEVWEFYNNSLISFVEEHRHSSLVIHIDTVINSPQKVIRLINQKFGYQLGTADEELFSKDRVSTEEPPLSLAAAELMPEIGSVWERLVDLAEWSPSTETTKTKLEIRNSATGAILSQWQKMRALERQISATAAAGEKRIADLSNELRAVQESLATELQRHTRESQLRVGLRTAKNLIIQTIAGNKAKR
ncbi:MAG: sulfotransferase [Candidatus Obscuribacterales bacterium]|nr:sulfotransferase [Candidatus Obscuribacterales bacterium]